jgi:hypothetical protein
MPFAASAPIAARAVPKAAVARTCQEVAAVLSDGPDPSVDPVGYALAQILPLRQIRTRDKALSEAIRALASAYARFYAANGVGKAAKEDVARATKRLKALCPGAGL